MRTKDPDVFDRVKHAHFDDGSQAVTAYDAELLWAYRLVRKKHYLKDAVGQKHSPIGFGYLRVRFIMVGCWYTTSLPATIVSRLGSVGTTTSVASLASGF